MYFHVNEFVLGVNDNIFSGNEQQNVYFKIHFLLGSVRRRGFFNELRGISESSEQQFTSIWTTRMLRKLRSNWPYLCKIVNRFQTLCYGVHFVCAWFILSFDNCIINNSWELFIIHGGRRQSAPRRMFGNVIVITVIIVKLVQISTWFSLKMSTR